MSAERGRRETLGSLRQIERTSAAEGVREQVLALIQGGGLAVGDRLPSEQELARSLGVSRPIVREGLGALRAAGLIESRSGSGTFVTATEPTRSALVLLGEYSVEDLHEVRVNLEVPGAGLAAQRRTSSQAAELGRIVARHGSDEGAASWVDDDVAFHVLLAEATGNELHARLVRELRGLQREQNVVVAELTDLEAPAEEHGAIVEAVERRDVEAAEAAMAAHLGAILERARAATRRGRD